MKSTLGWPRREVNWLHVVVQIGFPIITYIGAQYVTLSPNTAMMALAHHVLGGISITAGR